MSLGLRILGTGSALPGPPVDNTTLLAGNPQLCTPEWVEQWTGILSRHRAGPEDSVASLAAQAGRQALDMAGLQGSALRRILLTCSSGGDRPGPATAPAVQDLLGASCGAWDVNNGCTGFLSAFDLGARLVATGEAPVLIVGSELLTRSLLNPNDRRSWPLFGDGAAAVVLGQPRGQGALLSSVHANRGDLRHALYAPGQDDPELADGPWIRMAMHGRDMRDAVENLLPPIISQALEQAGVSADELDWVAPHQPNAAWLERLCGHLGVPLSKVPQIVHRTGNVPSAMVPLGMDLLWRGPSPPRSGSLGLLASVGAGVGVGAAVLRVD